MLDDDKRDGSISPLPISIRYRYLWSKISVISISFTAALCGVLIYFIIAHKVVSQWCQCHFLTSVTRCNEVTHCQWDTHFYSHNCLSLNLTYLKSPKNYDKISNNYRYFTCYRSGINILKEKPTSKVSIWHWYRWYWQRQYITVFSIYRPTSRW